jgi:hypothetical protein
VLQTITADYGAVKHLRALSPVPFSLPHSSAPANTFFTIENRSITSSPRSPEGHLCPMSLQRTLCAGPGSDSAIRPHPQVRRPLLHVVCHSITADDHQSQAVAHFQCGNSPPVTQTLAPVRNFPQLLFLPIDSNPRARIRPPLPNRYHPMTCCHVACPVSPQSNLSQICFQIQI